MTPLPTISIVIPTRNRRRYLERGLNRLRESDYPALEVIVVDGASTDGTPDLLRSYGNGVITWVSEPDRGESDAFNKGVRMSSGQYVNHFTDDDVMIPSALWEVGAFAARHPDAEIIFAQVNLWREIEGRPVQYGVTRYLNPEAIKPSRYFRWWPGPPTQGAFVRRSLFERVGLYEEDYVVGDYEFWARAIKLKAKCVQAPIIVADYHYTGANTVLRRAEEIRRDHPRIVAAHGTLADRVFVRLQLREGALATFLALSAHRLGIHPFRWVARWRGWRESRRPR